MNRRTCLTALAATAVAGPAFAADAGLTGTWSGTLQAGPVTLRLLLIIKSPTEASIVSLDQGQSVIPASKVSVAEGGVKLEFASVQAVYEAKLEDKDTLKGTFTQGGKPLPLEFKRGDAFTAAFKPEALSQTLLETYRKKAGTPAMGAIYATGDGPVKTFVDGLRSTDAATLVTAADQWHLGSITKSMTATLVARLVEACAIKWTTTVGEVLGDKVKDMNPAYAKANFLHLLSHRAGLQPNIEIGDLLKFSRDKLPDPRGERLTYASLALRQAPAAALADKMIYANNGFIIAGVMIEAVTGKAWETLISEQVFAPLGLKSAGFGPPGTPGKLDQPVGHAPDGKDAYKRIPFKPGTGLPTDNPVALGPAGRVHMSLSDLSVYLKTHLLKPLAFLKPESFETLHTPPFGGNYALGWFVSEEGRLWHNGSNTLWYAEAMIDTTRRRVAAVTANDAFQSTTMPAVNALLRSSMNAE